MDLQRTVSGCLDSNAAKHCLSCAAIAEVKASGQLTEIVAFSWAAKTSSVATLPAKNFGNTPNRIGRRLIGISHAA